MEMTKCKGFGCPLKSSCKRFKETPEHGDTYFRGVPFLDEEGVIICWRYEDKDVLLADIIDKIKGGNDAVQ